MFSRLSRVAGDNRQATRLALIIIGISILPRLIFVGSPIWDAHSWNQCSAASVARNLLRSDFDWLHPEWDVLKNHSALPHIEAEEAPVYHTLVALGYTVFGESLAWARLVTILLYVPGALWLFGLARRHLGNRAALAGLLFYAFVPVNVFFNRAIASDTGMVSFSIGALYYFDGYASDGGKLRYLAAAACLALAGLFKPFGLLVCVPILALSLGRWKAKALVRPSLWLFAVVGLAAPLAWVAYASSISSLGRGADTAGLFGTIRLWGSPKLLFTPHWWATVQAWLFDRSLTPPVAMLAGVGILAKQIRSRARPFIWWIVGCLLYLLTVREGNAKHVYYTMPWIPPMCALAGGGLAALLDWQPKKQSLQRIAAHRTAIAALLLAAFAAWTIPYSYNFFRADRSSFIAANKARELLPENAKIIAWDPGSTRKTQLIYHADRKGWHVNAPSPERIEDYRLLGAAAVVACLSDEQAEREDRAKTLEYLEDNFDLIWSDRGPYGKRGEPHRLFIFEMPAEPHAEIPFARFARELSAENVSGPWHNLLPFPDKGNPDEHLTREELSFGLVKHLARGRLIHFLDSRESLLMAPSVEYSFPLTVPERARLTFSATAWPEILDAFGGRVTITAEFADDSGEVVPLSSIVLKRKPLLEASRALRESWQLAYLYMDFWEYADADLWKLAGRKGRIVFRCYARGTGEPGDLAEVRRRAGAEVPFAIALGEPTIRSYQPLDNVRNYLVILVDGMRPDALGCYGYQRATSPNIDRLASSGALFLKAYAPSNYTRGSTSALFTGSHPGLLGVPLGRWSISPLEKFAFRQTAREGITQRLRDKGYVAQLAGSNPFLQEPVRFGLDAGFERVYSFNLRALDTEAITAAASRFLKENRDRPFLLYLHYNNCHEDLRAPKPFQGRFDNRIENDTRTWPAAYDEEVAYADHAIGELIDLIHDLGLADKTLVIVTADHGSGYDCGHPGGHGWSLYSSETRVPLIISGPGVWPGTRYHHMVSLLDLAPTLAAAADIPPDLRWPGTDLGSALAGIGEPLHDRIWLESGIAVGLKKLDYSVSSKIIPSIAPYSGTPVDAGLSLEIYDDRSDPGQLHNLAAGDPALAHDLGAELFGHKRLLDTERWGIARSVLGTDARIVGGPEEGESIYADTFDGTYSLELIPPTASGPEHTISGRISCCDAGPCWIDMFFPGSGDIDFSISEDRDSVEFSTALEDKPVSLSWRTFPEITPFTIELYLDGELISPDQLCLGPWAVPYAEMPARLGSMRDYELLVSKDGAPQIVAAPGFRAVLWMKDRNPATATGVMADEVKGALRQWGYVK